VSTYLRRASGTDNVLDIDEPCLADDAYISADTGVGSQPTDQPSVMAGFVVAIRLHVVLERT
jgi:hypothetical protein